MAHPADPPPDDEPHDAWEQADRAWHAPPDRWAEADRRWNRADLRSGKKEFAHSPDPAPGPAPSAPTAGLRSSYARGMSSAGSYIGVGAQIAASMLGFVGIGLLVDRWAGTEPWGVLGGAVMGLAGMIAIVIRLSVEASARSAKQKGESL